MLHPERVFKNDKKALLLFRACLPQKNEDFDQNDST